MRTIIAGGRNIDYWPEVAAACAAASWPITKVIHGCAKGVDTLGEWYGEKNNIPVERFPAEWERLGRAAGPIRNEEMAQNADALIAVWDGKSKGTMNMIYLAYAYKLKVLQWIVEPVLDNEGKVISWKHVDTKTKN